MPRCEKLPAIIELNDYDGDYLKYESVVYETFYNTFECKKFYWNNKPIYQKKHPLYKEKSGTFWHIVSSGNVEEERLPDLRRYERIAWPAYILEMCEECLELRVWKNKRGGKTRVLLWCVKEDYLVVLDERKEFYLFWTAYPIERKHTREKLRKEYESFISSNPTN